MTRSAAAQANQAADALLAWLRDQNWADRRSAGSRPSVPAASAGETRTVSDGTAGEGTGTTSALMAVPPNGADADSSWPAPDADPSATIGPRAVLAREDARRQIGAPLRLAHIDWLHHHLTVTGPASALASFRTAASGAGIIPWRLDLDRLEEDSFYRLVAPPAPHQRTLSLAGARILARRLRDAVQRRHDVALAQLGRSRACPFDLHALIPVPEDILQLGPDDPAALAWLWTRWGTTEALRHVVEETATEPGRRCKRAAGEAAFRVTFWSADWTPWRALATLATRWPDLRFTTRPTYDDAP